ncbi:MAG: GAF domain-containing protein [Ardenticatenaceae bacterium]|nr:GAF domain-containing protein [Ardenticatenaceae bacterium]
MQNWIKRLLAPPTFPGDAEKTRIASLLNVILLALTAIFIVNTAVAFLFNPSPAAFWLNAGTIGLTIGLLVILRRGHVRVASLLTLSVFWVAVAGLAFFLTGLSLTIVTSFFVLIVLASALTSQRTMVVFVLLTLVAVGIAAYLEISGRVTPPLTGSFLVNITSGAGNLVAMAVVLYLTSTALQRALQDLQEKNQALAEVQANLEVRIAERTRDLALAAEVGRNLAQVRSLDQLLQDASELIRERFNLYHVQIYLADIAQQTLILRGGAGQAARELLSRGHKLSIAHGSINGSAALNKKPIIVTDTRTSAVFRPNPLLPDTRSEMAVPLLIGDRVLGVLDLQSAAANSLTEDVLPAFATVASQLAVSIENADLFTAASQARAEVESYLRRLTREGWADYLDAISREEKLAYTYDSAESVTVSSPGVLPISAGSNALQLPIFVADESIGLVQVEADDNRHWTEDARALVSAVGQQVAQQVENLRLLEEAQRYRAEAETAIRRMTHEGWQAYVQDGAEGTRGYLYDRNRVRPLSDVPPGRDTPALEQPLQVHGQTIGNLALYGSSLTPEAANLLQLVGARLGDHLENLRLTQQTESALQEAERRSAELSQLNQLVATVSSSLDIQENLNIMARELARAVNADTCGIALFNPDRTALTVVAEYINAGEVPSGIGAVIPIEGNLSTQQVLATRQTLVISNAFEHPLTEPIHDLLRARQVYTIAILPIIVNNEIIGTVGLDVHDPHHQLEARQLRLAETIILQVSTVIQNARLYTQLEERAEELAAINRIAQAVSQQLEPEQLLQSIYENIQQVMQVDAFTVSTYDAGRHLLTYPYIIDKEKRYEQAAGPPRPGSLIAQIINTGTPILLNHTAEERDRLQQQPGLSVGDSEIPPSTMFVPLLAGPVIKGAMSVQSYRYNAYTEHDLALLSGIANHVAVALENARLYSQAQRQAQRERMVNTISQKIQSTTTVESALKTAVQELGQAFRARYAQIELAPAGDNIPDSDPAHGHNGS